jgi:hypothetical protein
MSNESIERLTENRPSLPKGLQQEINRFAIDGFAHKFFATHKKGLFRRTVPMDEMLKWTRVKRDEKIEFSD